MTTTTTAAWWDVADACVQRCDHGAGKALTLAECVEAVEHPLTGKSRTELVGIVAYLSAQVVGLQHGQDADAKLALAQIAPPAASKYPDLITPGRELLNATGKPWVMENVPKAPLRRDLVLCGTQFGMTATDTDGTLLHLKRHRVFETSVPLDNAGPCVHPQGAQWAGVYGGARKDKVEARMVRHGGYVPPDADVQSALLGGVPWMTGKGRRECIPPAYAEWVGWQLLSVVEGAVNVA